MLYEINARNFQKYKLQKCHFSSMVGKSSKVESGVAVFFLWIVWIALFLISMSIYFSDLMIYILIIAGIVWLILSIIILFTESWLKRQIITFFEFILPFNGDQQKKSFNL